LRKKTLTRKKSKRKKKVGIGKAIAGVAGTVLSVALFIITKGKSGGTKA